jgi:hypothetical protein
VVELSPKDSSILTRIARYQTIPIPMRKALLKRATPKAREIGAIILGTSTGQNADVETMAAAEAYIKSFPRKTRVVKSKVLRKRK